MKHWRYRGEEFTETPDDYQGFVYRIEDLTNDRYYIGKKNFWAVRKLKPLKNKTNRRHRRESSDWREYYGSSQRLKQMVAMIGPEHFDREILVLCRNKNQMNYFEMKIQFELDVLRDPRSYNEYIGGRASPKGL